MFELLEKTILAGVGALSLTQKKTEELAADLKEKLNLSEDKGRELLEKLRNATKENQDKLVQIARDEVAAACKRLGVVTRDEFDAVLKRLAALEKKSKG